MATEFRSASQLISRRRLFGLGAAIPAVLLVGAAANHSPAPTATPPQPPRQASLAATVSASDYVYFC